jgi:hypothetical protein
VLPGGGSALKATVKERNIKGKQHHCNCHWRNNTEEQQKLKTKNQKLKLEKENPKPKTRILGNGNSCLRHGKCNTPFSPTYKHELRYTLPSGTVH